MLIKPDEIEPLKSFYHYLQADLQLNALHLVIEIVSVCSHLGLHVLFAKSIALLLLSMAVSIASRGFNGLNIIAAIGIRHFGNGNDTATWKPATYGTFTLTPLLRDSCVLQLAGHTLTKQPVPAKARHLDDVVGL